MLGALRAGRMSRVRSRRPRSPVRSGPAAAAFVGAVCLAAVCLVLAGCTAHRPAAPPIQVSTAYVAQPGPSGITDAYVVIQNIGSPDRLIAARSSAGGRVTFRGPADSGSVLSVALRDIGIPHDSTVRFDPDGYHLLITGSGPMKAGTEITLTLIFARAGAIAVPALVENPESGGSSYLGD
jgi:copper(I)-binding protein